MKPDLPFMGGGSGTSDYPDPILPLFLMTSSWKYVINYHYYSCGCVLSCVGCGLPRDPGNCGFNVSSEVRYFFDASSGQCQQFEYESCSGNGNNFETMQECQDTCRELARTVTSWCSHSPTHIHPPTFYPSIHPSICPFFRPFIYSSIQPCIRTCTHTHTHTHTHTFMLYVYSWVF